MSTYLSLSERELAIVHDILRAHLPANVSVHVFGSRAGDHPKQWSDLDLVLEAPAALPLELLAALAEAFDSSDLPWKVDLVDRRTVSVDFGRLIDRKKVALS